jgi:hypothetical protein
MRQWGYFASSTSHFTDNEKRERGRERGAGGGWLGFREEKGEKKC